jgi:hypothetical protein
MSSVAAFPAYPARMEAHMDQPLSRWLWLVKWVLVIPHVIVLIFLWAAFAVLSVVTLVAIFLGGSWTATSREHEPGGPEPGGA